MKFRKIIMGFILISAMALTAACGLGNNGEETAVAPSSEKDIVAEWESEQSLENESYTKENADELLRQTKTAALETIAELLGKPDLQAAELFGGGEENWSEDKSFYIGRIYQVNLFDEEVTLYTSCDDKQLVNSVSIWLANGEKEVYEEDVLLWVGRLEEFTGIKPDFYDASSEGGSKNWKWFLGDRAVTLNWLEDVLTISMNVVKGELN